MSAVERGMAGLTAYVKFSSIRPLIEDDHPIVSWVVGEIVSHFFGL